MKRRRLLQIIAALPLVGGLWRSAFAPAEAASRSPSRVRPGDPAWPSQAEWDRLSNDVRLIKVQSPLAACIETPSGAACAEVFKELKNPYYLGDEVGLTQSSAGSTPGLRRRAPTRSPPRRPPTSPPPSVSRASTTCGSSSRAAATAISAPRTRRTRC